MLSLQISSIQVGDHRHAAQFDEMFGMIAGQWALSAPIGQQYDSGLRSRIRKSKDKAAIALVVYRVVEFGPV